MKINFNQILKGFDGKPLKREGDDVKLSDICIEALAFYSHRDEKLDEKEKIKRFLLAQDIYKNNTLDLKVEDVALLKKLIGMSYTPLIVGLSFTILEGK